MYRVQIKVVVVVVVVVVVDEDSVKVKQLSVWLASLSIISFIFKLTEGIY